MESWWIDLIVDLFFFPWLLCAAARRTCPGFVNRPWRARKEYTIYNSGEEEERQHGDQELIRRRPKAAKKLTNDVRPKRVPPKSGKPIGR